jgi:hypothetical protein
MRGGGGGGKFKRICARNTRSVSVVAHHVALAQCARWRHVVVGCVCVLAVNSRKGDKVAGKDLVEKRGR